MKKHSKTYLISILIPLAAGGLSAFFTRNDMNLYQEITTPPLSPPSWLFPVVWTVLYILMGISCARIYLSCSDKKTREHGLLSYGISLFMNFMWSIIFFKFRSFLFAALWLAVMLFFILRTIYYYNKIDPLSARLQYPYALWSSFALYLNIAIWLLNK